MARKQGSTKKHREEIAYSLHESVICILKYIFLLMCSTLIYLGYEVYKKAQPTSSFDSFIWLSITFLMSSFLIYGIFRFKFKNEFMFFGAFLLILPLFGVEQLNKISLSLFLFGLIYDVLCIFGLKVETKMFWRNKRV